MRRAVASGLAMCLVWPSLSSGAGDDEVAKAIDGSKAYKVKAIILSADLQTMQVTYLDDATGRTRLAMLSGKAASQVVEMKWGTSVNLQLRNMSEPNAPVVESIKKRSHKKLVIVGLVLATVVAGSVAVVSMGPI